MTSISLIPFECVQYCVSCLVVDWRGSVIILSLLLLEVNIYYILQGLGNASEHLSFFYEIDVFF